jgi:protein-S-isoprenylcysteine O-methyltransferase Ste14
MTGRADGGRIGSRGRVDRPHVWYPTASDPGNSAMTSDSSEIPHVIAPPPLIYGIPLLIGLVLQHFRPLAFLPPPWAHLLGPICVALGLVGLPALVAFRRAGTHPEPWRPVTALVVSGPYRLTRNPMYLGFTLLYLGVSLWVNSAWPLFALPLVLWTVHRGVVLREEAYMEHRFGEAYRAYRARVRRWL